ncbi:MAG: hypothetical protein HRT53_17090 [Colwellia sp.]|nr:hypothetical protein [Colwellia sp.]
MKLFIAISMKLFLPVTLFICSATGAELIGTQQSNASETLSISAYPQTNFSTLVEKYQTTIEEIESKQGVYGEDLSQQLFSLGMAYQQKGEHGQAIETLTRSLHLNRINNGLYSTSIFPILNTLINSLAKEEQWNSVDNHYTYLNWLYEQNYNEEDIETFAIKMQMANWYLKSYTLKRHKEPIVDLLNCYYAYEQALNIAIKKYGLIDLRVIKPLHQLILVNYLIAVTDFIQPTINIDLDGHIIKSTSRRGYQLNSLKSKSFDLGVSLFKHEMAIYSKQPLTDHLLVTRIKLKLADWYLMYGKREPALGLYHTAYNYLKDNSAITKEFRELFSLPVVLPNFPNISIKTNVLPTDFISSSNANYVHASIDVTRYGKVKNINFVSSNPKDNAMSIKVLKFLKKTKFRPKIVEGNVISAKKVHLQIFQ